MHADPSNPDCLIDIAPEHSTSISKDSVLQSASLCFCNFAFASHTYTMGFEIVIFPASKIESR
jgi:hypothetical protein